MEEDNGMKKEAAIAAMEQGGYKVAHRFFGEGEYIWGGHCEEDGSNYYIDEQGYQLPADEFWACRQGEAWNTGWRIVG